MRRRIASCSSSASTSATRSFDIEGWRLSCQVITFENTYGLPSSADVQRGDALTTISTDRLTWAGGQRTAPGSARIEARRTDDGIEVTVTASMPRRIRCTKLIVGGLPDGELLGHRWSRQAVTRGGTTVHYPSTTHTALAFLDLGGGEHLYFESLDDHVRAKRFAFMRHDDGIAVELIHEDAAHEMTGDTRTPPWRIGRTRDPEAVVRRHDEHVARGVRHRAVGDARRRAGVGARGLARRRAARHALERLHLQHVRRHGRRARFHRRAHRRPPRAGVPARLGRALLLAVRRLSARAGAWRRRRDSAGSRRRRASSACT